MNVTDPLAKRTARRTQLGCCFALLASCCVVAAACDASYSSTSSGGAGAPDAAPGHDAGGAVDASGLTTPDAAQSEPGDSSMSPPSDAGADSAIAVNIVVVQTAQASTANDVVLDVPIAPSKAGDLVVVLVSTSTAANVTSITDDAPGGADTFVSAGLRSSIGSCQGAEIWYARNVSGGASTVKVVTTVSGTLCAWVLEVSGALAAGAVAAGTVGETSMEAGTIVVPPVMVSAAPAFVVSSVGSCGMLGTLEPASPFTALELQNGNGGAYYIAPSVGAYGPIFVNDYQGWNASTAAFR
jgi:hypothetical protein